jgi:hypothetical protein
MHQETLKKIEAMLVRVEKMKAVIEKGDKYIKQAVHSPVDDIIKNVNQFGLEGIPLIKNVDTYVSGEGERMAHKDVVLGKIAEVEGYLQPLLKNELTDSAEPKDMVNRICLRFHAVARQLRSRREGRPTLDVEDEYDVQDLLHALLKIYFDDIRPEEWTPSYAGRSARMDFLLKPEKIVIEAKKTRKGLGSKEIGDELIVDIERYKEHPDCKLLFCFVYDPDGRISNPQGIEKDLSGQKEGLSIQIFIGPKEY